MTAAEAPLPAPGLDPGGRGFGRVPIDRRDSRGAVLDTVELDASIFGTEVNVPLMHQVVVAQLAARRAGTQSTRTRAEVAGGGAKPYRQKGTGRARQGTNRAPQFAGGGVAHGPKPRSYRQRTPRKMIRRALVSALSDRASEGRVVVIDRWGFEAPRTKDAVALLDALGLDGTILVVLGPNDAVAERSFANLPEVELVESSQLTAYEVLSNRWVVFTTDSVPGGAIPVEGSARASTVEQESAEELDEPEEDEPGAEDPGDLGPETHEEPGAEDPGDLGPEVPGEPES